MKWRCRGKFHLQGRLKRAKDYSVGDGGQGVEGKGVKYVGDGAVTYRIIFSRRKVLICVFWGEVRMGGKRGDFGGCGWKCLGGESVRRWHGGDERDDNDDVWREG